MSDIVRVLRVIEYTGEYAAIVKQLARSMRDGTHHNNPDVVIKIATVGDFPEILDRVKEEPDATK